MAFHLYAVFAFIVLSFLSFHYANANALNWTKQSNNVGFAWANCGTGGDPFQIQALSISPDPIKIPGPVTISLSIALSRQFPADLTAITVVEKDYIGFWVKLPCVNNVGSCTYPNLCTNMTQTLPTFLEPFIGSRKCPPIPAGTYSMANVVIDVTKSIPSEVTGVLRVTIDFLSNSAGQLGCLQMIVNLSN